MSKSQTTLFAYLIKYIVEMRLSILNIWHVCEKIFQIFKFFVLSSESKVWLDHYTNQLDAKYEVRQNFTI